MTINHFTHSMRSPVGTGIEKVRNYNLSLLARAAITSNTPLSRADLAAKTRLNKSTVTRLVDTLIHYGILVEQPTERTTSAGRPSVPLSAAAHTHVTIGAEISDSSVRTCIVDLRGKILSEHIHEFIDQPLPENVFPLLVNSLKKHEKQIRSSHMNLVGITCGFPGLVSENDGVLFSAPSMSWKNISLPDMLNEFTSSNPYKVHFENSINLEGFNELIHLRRHNDSKNSFLYISGSSGIGSAIVRNGVIYTGARGFAGEIGHIAITENDVICSCGSTGCLETVAGRRYIMRQAGFPSDAPIAHLYAALHRNDPQALTAMSNVGTILGKAIAASLNLFDLPEVRLGGIFADLFPHMKKELQAEIDERVLTSTLKQIQVSKSLGDERAASEGGAWRMLLNFIDSPDTWTVPDSYALTYYDVDQTPEVTI
ncbi:Sugar kinase of the NBD/HSP70 family, may contain an N-terminal HTH domain [Arcanobacterium phocae]|uniref:Sugar kinase of the NBD/HSP70 family, may contain an N-terminal HTH domain n=2 Tax=Arcanobacterium phocae TaxID=131112 RepID=A0A1H2LBX0_9ACTO|nr:Sugar kinase of the NBD/HSP70 family, may contain an N-terminal HTH domain [Arcanobacterium phocae]